MNCVQHKEVACYGQNYSRKSDTVWKTSEQWNVIWLNKFERVAKKEGVGTNKSVQMASIISSFLQNNPGSPYYIKKENFLEYLKTATSSQYESILFFYSKVAVSSVHQELIKQNNPHKEIIELPKDQENRGSERFSGDRKPEEKSSKYNVLTDEERKELLEKLRLEINARNLSRCTLSNYTGAVSRFLNFLNQASTSDWSNTFKSFLVWLRDEQMLAASTINQYAASVAFFMEEVLELKRGEDLLIRMKTGKALPRLHSLEKVSLIISAPTNYKHRLILMLCYGCGLRLGEVCVLKPTDIDMERHVVRIRSAKGKKDRIVMLDNELEPYVRSWLKRGCGKEYLFEGYVPGKHLTKRTVERIYTNACEKLGIDTQGGIHSLRHSFATHLLEQGVDLRYIQELLGHASTKTTEIYTHVAAHKIAIIRSPIASLLKKDN